MPAKLEVYKCDQCGKLFDPKTYAHMLINSMDIERYSSNPRSHLREVLKQESSKFSDKVFCDTSCISDYLVKQLCVVKKD